MLTPKKYDIIIKHIFLKDGMSMKTKVKSLTLYTGFNGQRGCTCKCKFCTQIFPSEFLPYQGTLEEIHRIIKELPNLENAYILGNPDVSVDAKFCNQAAKEFIKIGCNVMFSTSGIGGKHTMEKLLQGLSPKKVNYVSFSVDSLNRDTVKFLKGVDLPLSQIESGIQYCLEHNIPVKIQPTLWTVNQNEVESIVTYFLKKYNIHWFTFHIGSLETYHGNENWHLSAKSVRKVYEEIKKLQQIYNLEIKIPMNMLNKSEYAIFQTNYTTHCTDIFPEDIQVWMTANGLKASYCPVFSTVYPDSLFDLEFENKIAPGMSCKTCPVQKQTLGPNFQDEGYIPVCLYYKP